VVSPCSRFVVWQIFSSQPIYLTKRNQSQPTLFLLLMNLSGYHNSTHETPPGDGASYSEHDAALLLLPQGLRTPGRISKKPRYNVESDPFNHFSSRNNSQSLGLEHGQDQGHPERIGDHETTGQDDGCNGSQHDRDQREIEGMALWVMEERWRRGLTISTTVHKTDHSLVHSHSHLFLFVDITDVIQDDRRDERIAGHVDSCIVTSGTYTKTASGSCLGRIQYRKEQRM